MKKLDLPDCDHIRFECAVHPQQRQQIVCIMRVFATDIPSGDVNTECELQQASEKLPIRRNLERNRERERESNR
jgi:hypothetical protein